MVSLRGLIWGSRFVPRESSRGGSRWVLLLLTIILPSQLIYSPLLHPSTNTPNPTAITGTVHTHSLSLTLCLSLSFSFSLDGCEDASSTLQWRQIRPSRPCHRKTSPRKVVTSSPLQLICRHSKSGEKVGCPCNSITTSSTLSQERKA